MIDRQACAHGLAFLDHRVALREGDCHRFLAQHQTHPGLRSLASVGAMGRRRGRDDDEFRSGTGKKGFGICKELCARKLEL